MGFKNVGVDLSIFLHRYVQGTEDRFSTFLVVVFAKQEASKI
jgi:hypothetical protein